MRRENGKQRERVEMTTKKPRAWGLVVRSLGGGGGGGGVVVGELGFEVKRGAKARRLDWATRKGQKKKKQIRPDKEGYQGKKKIRLPAAWKGTECVCLPGRFVLPSTKSVGDSQGRAGGARKGTRNQMRGTWGYLGG